MLSTAELNTLEILSDRENCDKISRTHLEKLSRLDLIEPCPEGVCISARGREILESR
jgi:hypothetical protein